MAGKNVIVVPTDFSERSLAALPWARRLADQMQAEIHCVYVVEEPHIYATLDMGPVPIPSVDELSRKGRVFMPSIDCPFRTVDRELARIPSEVGIVLVDIHAEVTSEKQAMGWHLDGKVTAVVGTHTHVATADERVLPGGTAFITDVGMTGPHDSVIGMEKDAIIRRFFDSLPTRFEVAEKNLQINCVWIETDAGRSFVNGRAAAKSIARTRYLLD